MKNTVFLTFCSFLVALLVSAHALFRQTLMSPDKSVFARVEALEKEREEAEFRAKLVAHQLADYQSHVATLIPQAIKGQSEEQSYPLRQLASVITASPGALNIERASGLLEKAKGEFRDGEFAESNRLFAELIERYPTSGHVTEAHFLLAEGQFQLRDYEASVATIERMVDRFPESELTGFALLRLAHVFEIQDRLEDASDVYKAVLSNFKQKDLLNQASQSLKGIAL